MIDRDASCAHVHRDPFGARYRRHEVAGPDDQLDAPSITRAPIAVSDVLKAADR